jgi:hypothetical protein
MMASEKTPIINKKISTALLASRLKELTSEEKARAAKIERSKLSLGAPAPGPRLEEHASEKRVRAAKIERLNRLFAAQDIYEYPHPSDKTHDADTREDLRSMRSLLKIAPSDSDVSVDLYVDGLNSAHHIARMGCANFLAQYGPKLGDEAKRIHVKAINQSMMSLNLFVRHSPTFNSVGLAALPSQTASVPEIPEWTSLFGTLNICDIADDRSVLSPAAYLVDVLHFLDQQKLVSASGKEQGEKRAALEVLLERRPDIAWLELSSINTFTTLPYVDLVNEVLEAAVFPLKFRIKAGFEKELDKKEISPALKAEFTKNCYELSDNARVLVKEEEKGSKWHIRDGSWIFEINLGYGGLDVAVSTAYQTGAAPNELAANPEYLDARAYDILAQQIYPWNLPFDLWAEAARVYLTHLGIPRYKLMELFHTEKTRAISVATEYLGLSAKEREIITGTDKESKPWQYWGLDEEDNSVSTKSGTDKLDWTEALQRVPVFLERSGMSYEQLLDLLATTFINPDGSIEVQFPTPGSEGESTITSSCDIERAVIATTEPDDTFNKIHRFIRLQRKTGWSIQEFDTVIRVLAWQDLDDDFIIAARYLRQLQAELRVPLNELLSWYANIDTARSIKGASSFYEQLFLNKSVLRPVDEKFELNKDKDDLAGNDDLGKKEETLKGHASTILAALKISDAELDFVIAAEFPGNKDAPLNLENLSRVHRVVSLSRASKLSIEDFYALKAMRGIDPFNRNDIAATLHLVEMVRLVRASGFRFPELDYLVRTIERPEASIMPAEAEIEQVLAEIRDGLKKIADERASSESYVKQKLSNALKLESEVINDLLTKWLSDAKILDTFIDPKFVDSDQKISPDHFPEQFGIYRLLHRIAVLVLKFKITPSQLEWLFNNGNGPQKPGYAQLKEPAELFDQWERLVYLFRLRDQLGEETLSKIFGKEEIYKSSILSENDFKSLKENGFIPENYGDKDRLKCLPDCLAALKRLGVGAEEVLHWCESDLPSRDPRESARNIKRAVKAKYDEQQWLEIARPLEDVLREKRRGALLSHHLAKKRLRDTYNLYQHFLLDVEMSPCMMTSRTKLAISSVQLFVQRCLMNLEEWRIPSPEQAVEWKRLWEWMKNYRVWEANRKVFLYPENWIEPELRRDKSPFFKDLENELLMGEMTAELAESAFLNYLEKLNEVARLEICGLYHEKETNAPKGRGETTVSVLHVFARTRGIPKVYYYRRRVDGAWTAWERVEVDIDGDHLIPVVFNRRLYLFWPSFIEKTETLKDKEGKEIKDAQGKQKTWESWEMQLAFSEYREGRWSAKKLSDEKLAINPAPKGDKAAEEFKNLGTSEKEPREPSDKKDFTFKTFIENEVLQILCACALRNPGTDPVSYSYKGGFRFMSDAQIDTLSEGKLEYVNLAYPISSPATGCHYENMAVKLDSGKHGLSLLANKSERKILAESSSSFTLIFPHQLPQEYWQDCFFYQDTERVFFVERKPTSESRAVLQAGESPELLGLPAYESVEAPLSEPSFPWEHSPVSASTITLQAGASEEANYYFEIAYHSLVHEFTKHLNRDGVDGLLRRLVQQMRRESLLFWLGKFESGWFKEKDETNVQRVFKEHGITFTANPKIERINGNTWEISGDREGGPKNWTCYVKEEPDGLYIYRDFKQQYAPAGVVVEPYPSGITDFDAGGFYAQYNWELFFHAPLMIADRLSKNQRFEEAQTWFHHIFDPTDTSGHAAPQRYWKVLPFFEEARGKPIQELMALLRYTGTDREMQEAQRKLKNQLEHWKQDPFQPHLIALLRPGAYQKTVVMKYIDNLIAWGDQLFRRDTIESINEATQLYILAAEILGKRPVIIPPLRETPVQTLEQIREDLDEFSNGPAQLEEVLPEASVTTLTKGTGVEAALGSSLYLAFVTDVSDAGPYFGIPRNDKLLSYWDTVADRLFKIRHCMTIEGVERQLPLFQPPIEPGLLVRAAAAGVDISSALRDLEVGMPQYRFGVVLQKAINLCNDVRALGSAFLSALEMRDAEGLAKLRMGQKEVDLRWIKQKQIEEAKEMLASLKKAKEIAEARKEYGEKELEMTDWEKAHLGLLIVQKSTLFGANIAQFFASKVAVIPDAYSGTAGVAGPLVFSKVAGGEKVSKTAESWAKGLEYTSKVLAVSVEGAKLMAQHQRKKEEWDHKKDVISKEIEQLDCQIAAVKIRVEIAQKELENYEREVKNAKEVDIYMRDRFTNLELYNWMVSQLSSLYFQSYQMAYDLAKRAEKAFHYELGQDDTTYIRFGYWDSLKKGLLAGEKLYFDLRRMEAAYVEHNKRNFEIIKHISLATYFPEQLILLREKGECCVDLPEMLFDLDYPGHYLRRIKSVSLSINGEVKPYTSVNCTLTLEKSEIRMNDSLAGDKYEREEGDDRRFKDMVGVLQSIATSSAQDDSGLFELNFNDERYLPFEGTGAISQWHIELPQKCNQIDVEAISDVVLHMQFTARDGGEPFRKMAKKAVADKLSEYSLGRLIDVKQEFAQAWNDFIKPADDKSVLNLPLKPSLFPAMFRGEEIQISAAWLFVALKDKSDTKEKFSVPVPVTLNTHKGEFKAKDDTGLVYAEFEGLNESCGTWCMTVEKVNAAQLQSMENMLILISYTVKMV